MTEQNDRVPAFDGFVEAAEKRGVTAEVMGRVLARLLIAAPARVSQADIARGSMLSGLAELSPATVTRAVAVLEEQKLITRHEQSVTGAGRPFSPLSLGSDSVGLIGVDVEHSRGHVVAIHASLTTLTLDVLEDEVLDFRDAPPDTRQLAEHVHRAVQRLIDRAGKRRNILGVGVGIGGHVDDGRIVVVRDDKTMHTIDLSGQLSTLLRGIPVFVENDVNTRALRQLYEHSLPERDFAVVAVFNEGLGGALVINGRLYTGASGVAGELGHVSVEYPKGKQAKSATQFAGFDQPCSCSQYGHAECVAVPARICAELGIKALSEATPIDLYDDEDEISDATRTFRRAGRGLGRALASLATTVNPPRIILLLPSELAAPRAGSAPSAYLNAVETTLESAFSAAARDARAGAQRLTTQIVDPADVAADGAQAAAAAVLHGLIDSAFDRTRKLRFTPESSTG